MLMRFYEVEDHKLVAKPSTINDMRFLYGLHLDDVSRRLRFA